jgi:RNA polymerase sigma factor (sigma-70 family)
MIDEAAFQAHRRELHVHCYRMVGNFEEAEDLVQETFLRAWKARERFSGNVRAWLYKVATNACLDALRRSRRRAGPSFAEIPWIQPYPDRLLDEVAPREDEPDAVVVARETIELAYMALIQRPPHPWLFDGFESIRPLLESLAEPGEWRLLPTAANRMPAAANYLRSPGDAEFRAFKLDVVRIETGRIKEITTFDAGLFGAFGLPPTLGANPRWGA